MKCYGAKYRKQRTQEVSRLYVGVAQCVGETQSRLEWSRVSTGGVEGNDIRELAVFRLGKAW